MKTSPTHPTTDKIQALWVQTPRGYRHTVAKLQEDTGTRGGKCGRIQAHKMDDYEQKLEMIREFSYEHEVLIILLPCSFVIMTSCFVKFILIGRRFVQRSCKEVIQMALWHELRHAQQPLLISRSEAEKDALAYSVTMMKEGNKELSITDILQLESCTRFLMKYKHCPKQFHNKCFLKEKPYYIG